MLRRSLRELLDRAAASRADAVAILAPGHGAMTYGGLIAQLDRVAVALRGRVAPDDRIAIIAPDDARTAIAICATMCCATLTPLDARLTRDELAAQLRRLRTTLVIVDPSSPASATLAAGDAGLPVVTIVGDDDASLAFSLAGLDALPPTRAVAEGPRGGSDLALVVCTSGTTGRPKLVPLAHDNVLTMMLINVDVLGLTPGDRCLGVMPLCHIHGLGAVLCALLAGGSIAVLPAPFNADAFYDGLRDFAPTWYTAVPTIHQALLDRAGARADVVAAARLRLVRSGSAPMPTGVPERLEATFRAPYIEASGATEASAYLCSNRPATRRIGSVGRAMPETELRVLDERGNPAAPGAAGELVARGPGVFAGYEDDADATRDAFTPDGWFRTGDLARVDADGFVSLVGRLKEQVNRGGSKVSPGEVEAALATHPAVASSAVFGVVDARLGQEVGAVVVLRDGATCTTIELQRHLAPRIADYKVPRHVAFAATIPVGPRGKVERLRLAEQLGMNAAAAVAAQPTAAKDGWSPPREPIEQAIAAIWTEVLGAEVRDVTAPFFALGGDSAQALSVCLKIERRFGRPMPLAAIGARPSIRALATLLADDGHADAPAAPIVLRDGDPARTLFVLPGVGGNVYSFHAVARRLPAGVRVVGLPLPGADGLEPPLRTMRAIAERYAAHVRALQPTGRRPMLAGYSFGGRVACEVARLLADDGGARPTLAMIDVRGPNWPTPPTLTRRVARRLRRALRPADGHATADDVIAEAVAPAWLPEPHRSRQHAMIEACDAAAVGWTGPSMAGLDAWLFRAAVPMSSGCDLSDRSMGWARPTRGTVRIVDVPGTHITMLHEPHVATLAARLGEALLVARVAA